MVIASKPSRATTARKTDPFVLLQSILKNKNIIQSLQYESISKIPGETIEEKKYHLISQCDLSNPLYRYIAGIFHIYEYNLKTIERRGYGYDGYLRRIQSELAANKLDDRIRKYSNDELLEAASWIQSDRDWDFDFAGASLLTSKYLREDELPQEAFLTIALLLALPEAQKNRLALAKKIYQALANFKISLATPILANLRVPNSNLSSCFISSCNDNINSIMDNVKNAALISKNGGGVGMNFSKIRASGSVLMGRENASGGVVPFIKLFNDVGVAVNQGGRRAGAITTSLDVWHLDIEHFLEMQTENGDQRRKCYDVFPQVVVADLFMQRVQNEETWTLIDPKEIKDVFGIDISRLWGKDFEELYSRIEEKRKITIFRFKVIQAKQLYKEILKAQIETGLPYLFFKDTANRNNPDKSTGYIPSGNLCVESFSSVKADTTSHVCNLASLNLANIDRDELEEYCKLAVRLLDNTMSLTKSPIAEAANHNDLHRSIGVGAMGLADLIAKERKSYRDLRFVSNLFEDIAYYCYRASADLAKEKGPYKLFPNSEWSKGLINCKDSSWYEENAYNYDRWVELARDIVTYGIRNCQILALAPNTSTSILQGVVASILPAFNLLFYNKHGQGSAPVMPKFVLQYDYEINKGLNQSVVVDAVATMQKWIDSGISMELLFNTNTYNAKRISDTIFEAWRKQCKAIYYVRTIQKDTFKEDKPDCEFCAN